MSSETDPQRIEAAPKSAESASSLRLFRILDRVNRAMQGTSDLEQMMSDVLDVVLEVFEVDRAWILRIDGDVLRWSAAMERTRPEYPGAQSQAVDLPIHPQFSDIVASALASPEPVKVGRDGDFPMPPVVADSFHARAGLATGIQPEGHSTYLFGLHQCSRDREWSPEDIRLFREIARRLTDGLTILLTVQRLRESEEALRKSEQRLRAYFETTNAGMLEVGHDGGILAANHAFAAMLGYTPEEIAAKHMSDLFFPDDLAEVRARWAEMRKGDLDRYNGEQRYRRKDGTPLFTLAHLVTLSRDSAGQAHSALAVVVDLTEIKRLEDHLQRAQKMEAIGRLAGGVAHDFNNLLTVINGYTEVLLSDRPSNKDWRGSLQAIGDAGQRASRLTSQLLAFSRKAIVQPRVLDLNEVIEVTSRMLQRLIGEDVTLVTHLRPDLSRVRADQGQMEQVLMNLAVNSRDAMPKGGTLTIETDEADVPDTGHRDEDHPSPGRYVRLRVSDTGCGMTEEVRARLFEPFFTTKEVGTGTGLGLAAVYGIVHQAGGSVSADSRVGEGTTFTILLPVVAVPQKPAEPPRIAGGGTETILLVEDEDAVRKLTKRVLELHGYTVLDAPRGADALHISETHEGPIHLLLTDVIMPQLGGRGVAEAVRERRPDIKILYMTGFTDDAVVKHGVSVAAGALLQKPFTPTELARKIRRLLDGAGPESIG